MRKPIKATEALATLTKGEAKAVIEITQEKAFGETYKPELRNILYCCQQLAKAQSELEILTGKLNPDDRLAHRKQTENILFQTAFNAVY